MSDPNHTSSDPSWDTQIGDLLTEFLDTQQATLDHLAEKREQLAKGDAEGLSRQQDRETALMDRLATLHERRGRLLSQAARRGMPAGSLSQLSDALATDERQRVLPMLAKASSQARLLRHHSLTNWVLAQRNLLHVSYLIEILISGGKLQPTYSNGGPESGSGVLVDHAA